MMNLNIAEEESVNQQNSDETLIIERANVIEKEFRRQNMPRGFRIDDEGVWFQPEDSGGGDLPPPIWICSPLEVIAIVRDHANENHGRLLEFKDVDGQKHVWAMPMELLASDGTRYREELLNKGLLIATGRKTKELLTQYIQQCQPIKRARCVLQTGWVGNNFVFPDCTIGPSCHEEVLYQSSSFHHFGYGQKGSLEEWQKISKLCRGNSRLIFALSVAFTSPVLYLLGEENGGFHLRGPSSIGKSTALELAASVWGGHEFLQSWRVTSNGLEGLATAHNDALLVLDEIEQMHSSEIGEGAYTLANGSGKVRSDRHGSARKKSSWRLLFLSTGEISLSEHMLQAGKKTRAGQEVRVIDIAADTGKCGIFEELHGFESGAMFADYLSEECRKCYGVAIIAFLKILILHRESILFEIQQIRDEFRKMELPYDASGQVTRGFNRFALVAAVGKVASKYGITGWDVEDPIFASMQCFYTWYERRGGSGMQEEALALSQIRKFFEQHGESRFTPMDNQTFETKTVNRVGFRKQTEDGITFFVLPESFKSEICAGLDHSYVAKICIQNGYLMPDKKGVSTRSERLPGIGKIRCYRFTSKVLSFLNEVTENEQEK